jgi:cellulose biosynthesis protein BcsQ
MIVTVANHKGGVGKTSLAAHLAFRAAERGNKVLAVDFDAQGNLTGTLADRGKALKADGAEFVNGTPPAGFESTEIHASRHKTMLADPQVKEVRKAWQRARVVASTRSNGQSGAPCGP